jgi:hypothetical protein
LIHAFIAAHKGQAEARDQEEKTDESH